MRIHILKNYKGPLKFIELFEMFQFMRMFLMSKRQNIVKFLVKCVKTNYYCPRLFLCVFMLLNFETYVLQKSIRKEMFAEFIDILDFILIESNSLYEKLTDNLIIILRKNFRKPRCCDNYLV